VRLFYHNFIEVKPYRFLVGLTWKGILRPLGRNSDPLRDGLGDGLVTVSRAGPEIDGQTFGVTNREVLTIPCVTRSVGDCGLETVSASANHDTVAGVFEELAETRDELLTFDVVWNSN